MTTVLAIDTAGPRLQLALTRGAETDVLLEDMAQGQAERLLPAIGELLARTGTRYADLDRVAVTTGPGSFTGLRIGLSAARGLGLALGIPVVGVPTLLAMSLAAAGGPVTVRLDARRGEAYVQDFSGPGVSDGAPVLLPVESARALGRAGAEVIADVVPDIGRVATFAADADAEAFPPVAAYVRDADAKPQDGSRIARAEPA